MKETWWALLAWRKDWYASKIENMMGKFHVSSCLFHHPHVTPPVHQKAPTLGLCSSRTPHPVDVLVAAVGRTHLDHRGDAGIVQASGRHIWGEQHATAGSSKGLRLSGSLLLLPGKAEGWSTLWGYAFWGQDGVPQKCFGLIPRLGFHHICGQHPKFWWF